MRRFSCALSLLAAIGCGSKIDPPATGPAAAPATPAVTAVVARLGDEDCAVRRAAALELLAAGREALPALEAARGSADPEVRVKAEEITAAIEMEPLVWIGTFDGRWENPDNWNPKHVPGQYSVAIVPETTDPLHAPAIRGEVVVRDLVLLRRAELTVEETAHLTVTGRLRSRGTLRALGVVRSSE
ncbi:MAG: hypothetical protein HYY18_19415 [Planctomycetes bacterium]|nr:hypothetical protein [Planctomycetota bacterium]